MASTKQMSDTFLVGILLAIVGGYLDAYSYISRGGVFANAQTGNIVLMGIHLAEGAWRKTLYYMIPIVAFIIGILLSELIKTVYKNKTYIHWRQIVILIEIFVIVVVAFIPEGSLNTYANILVSFICAMQVEAFRKIDGNAAATTMCTGNLRSATELLFHYRLTKDITLLHRSLKYYGIIVAFVIGAIAGTIGTYYLNVKSVLICSIILLVCFLLMMKKSKN
jgi:uncharacterized membrane protein YoaK (UPF0700 family)